MKKDVKPLWDAVGGLSKPSKMPCHSYSIPATLCPVGAKLRKVAGSTCASCYALKGRYVFPNVQAALQRRYDCMVADYGVWTDNMCALLEKIEHSGYFRWHDSGDLQCTEHLSAIVAIANRLPHIRFWLPTREYNTVARYLRDFGPFPANLVVRLSAHMIGKDAPHYTEYTSTVDAGIGEACKAPLQGNKCADCRVCWHAGNVDYRKH